jgi:hypothetical protein
MKTKTDTVFRYALAIVITLAVFYLLGALKSMVVPDMWRDTYIMIVGVVIGKWSTIVDYYWGTSKSSSDKTDLLNNKPS